MHLWCHAIIHESSRSNVFFIRGWFLIVVILFISFWFFITWICQICFWPGLHKNSPTKSRNSSYQLLQFLTSVWKSLHVILTYTKSSTDNCLTPKAFKKRSFKKIPWKEEPGRLQSMGSWRVWHEWLKSERLHFHFSLSFIGKGNGNPLQCSCLENPRDEGAWWTAIYGVTQGWTWLKRLSSSSSSRIA